MKRFSITHLFLFVTWCAIGFVAVHRYLAEAPYQGESLDLDGVGFAFDAGEATYDVEFTEDDALRSTPWHPADANPPISARWALAIGNRLRIETLEKHESWRWRLSQIALCPLDSESNRWCWDIHFLGDHVDHPSGTTKDFHAFVLMNGEVIEPWEEDPGWEPDSVFFNE